MNCSEALAKVGIFSLKYKINLEVILDSKSAKVKNIKAPQKLGTVKALLSPHLQADIANKLLSLPSPLFNES